MSWRLEISSPVSAARLFKAALLDRHNLAPKIMPVESGSLEGDGGVGSVYTLKFAPGEAPFRYVKARADLIDNQNCEYKHTVIEGGGLGDTLEAVSGHFKFEPTGDGGCVCRVVVTYKSLPGVDAAGETAKSKESVTKFIRATEAYLIANPAAYT